MILKKEVGKKIRHLRKIKKLTQEELGEEAGISYKFIGEIERGEVNPSLDTLTAIADALAVKIRDLFPVEDDFFLQFDPQEIQMIKKTINLMYLRLSPKKSKRN